MWQLLHSVANELTFMEWALVVGVLFLALLLAWAQFAPDEFDLRHLIANAAGMIDRWAFIAIAGFTFVTWGYVKLLFDGKGDWWLVLVYGLVTMFPKVIEQVAGPIIQQRFGAMAAAPKSAASPEGAAT